MKRAGALLGLALACATVDARAQIPAIGRGKTIDFVYDGSDVRHPTEAYVARLFLPGEVKKTPDVPRPLLVFLHGVNPDHVRFRFTGGKPDEPDLRLIVAEMVEAGTIPPVIVAAPSSVVSSELPTTLWPDFDLDRFVERTARTLRGKATIDLDAVIVVGHSGAGCNPKGGLASALAGTSLPVRAALSIDTCMTVADARALGDAPARTPIIVTWQPYTWGRPFDEFGAALREVAGERALVLDELKPAATRNVHNALVEISLAKHLPGLLAPPARPE